VIRAFTHINLSMKAASKAQIETSQAINKMKRRKIMKRVSSALAFLFVVACGQFPADGASNLSFGTIKDNPPPALRQELAEVRSATAKYHDISQAMDDGYVDINVFVSGQGFHYLKPSNLDAHFQLDKPELLVYAVDPWKNRLRLVCIEYAVPVSLSPTPPEGFTGDTDAWHLNEDFGLWTLHCWVWRENPNGMFAEVNPNVP
jgi:hypothetical protein